MNSTQRSEPGAVNPMLQASEANADVAKNKSKEGEPAKPDAMKEGSESKDAVHKIRHKRDSSFGNKDFAITQNDVSTVQKPTTGHNGSGQKSRA